ncbi:MAG: CHRD domain-containing protein [Nitrospirae bacterium]|nr:CHRD domain-containing protein [Nitrospirota bacterium]
MKTQKNQIRVIMLLIFAGIIMNAAVSAADHDQPYTLIAYLSANQDVPEVKTHAQGKIVFQISPDGNKLYYKFNIENVKDVTAAYIYMGLKGENGRAVVVLFDVREPWTKAIMEGTITAKNLIGPLVGNSLGALLQEMGEGNTYVKVRTDEYPEGHIRGQIVDPSSL